MKTYENDTSEFSTSAPAVRIGLLIGLGLLVCVPYFGLERRLLFPAMEVPLTSVDRYFPFVQPAIWAYLSLYLQLPLPLFLVKDLRQLRQMAFGFALIAVASQILFLFWPTVTPSLVADSSITSRIFRAVLAADTNGNALPSLHASLSIYCALCSARLLKSRRLRLALWAWTAIIVTSALLSKRHVALDLLAGSVLGYAVFFALFQPRPSESTECAALDATLVARNALIRGMETELALMVRLDWRKRTFELCCFGSLGLGSVWLTISSWAASRVWLTTLGIVGTALALNAFVLLMHDGMHSTLFQTRRVNRLGSVLLGSTFLMSYSAYRVMHTRHHTFLGDARDPDDYQNYVRRQPALWCLHFVRLIVGPLLYLALIPVMALKFASDHERRYIMQEYLFLLVAYSMLLRLVPGVLLLVAWLVPLLIVGVFTAVRGFTQHGITDASDPYLASRTILPNPIVGFFLLHENYHLEHHLFPEVPSYHLTRLHKLIWSRLPRSVSGRSYLGFLARFLRATPRLDGTPIGLENTTGKSA